MTGRRSRSGRSFALLVIAEATRRYNASKLTAVCGKCETCGNDVDASSATYGSNGKYAFCSEACYQDYLRSMED